MFTGLVTHRAAVKYVERHAEGGLTLSMSNPFPDSEPALEGESIAVNGCCLTALGAQRPKLGELSFFVSEETLSLSTLGHLQPGSIVNLERALRMADRFGGHLVSGHVDCIGWIDGVQPEGGSTCVTIAYPAAYAALVIVKGSVAIDGVSLTVNNLCDGSRKRESITTRTFTVNIIPHTNERTGFDALSTGDTVNLEYDMFAKFALRGVQLRDDVSSDVKDENECDFFEGGAIGLQKGTKQHEHQHSHRGQSSPAPVEEGQT